MKTSLFMTIAIVLPLTSANAASICGDRFVSDAIGKQAHESVDEFLKGQITDESDRKTIALIAPENNFVLILNNTFAVSQELAVTYCEGVLSIESKNAKAVEKITFKAINTDDGRIIVRWNVNKYSIELAGKFIYSVMQNPVVADEIKQALAAKTAAVPVDPFAGVQIPRYDQRPDRSFTHEVPDPPAH